MPRGHARSRTRGSRRALAARDRRPTCWTCGRTRRRRAARATASTSTTLGDGAPTLESLAPATARRAASRRLVDRRRLGLRPPPRRRCSSVGHPDARRECSTRQRAERARSVIGAHAGRRRARRVVEPTSCFDATRGPDPRAARRARRRRSRGSSDRATSARTARHRRTSIAASSIGDTCKVHGEVSTTIFLGHANKAHDGFVGHSYLGRWVNLGAGTITSNLKNTYGTVQLWTPRRHARHRAAVPRHVVRRPREDRHRHCAHDGHACSARARTCSAARCRRRPSRPFSWGEAARVSTDVSRR